MQQSENLNRAMETETIQKNEVCLKSLMSKGNKLFIGVVLLIFIIFLQSTALNAQEMLLINASVGRTGERDMNMYGYGDFKSKNTTCIDLGLGYYYGGDAFGLGLVGGLGIKSFELADLYDQTQGAEHKGNWELSIGPALYLGAPININEGGGSFVGLVLSAQPSYTVGKLFSAEDDVIVGSLGVKLSADLRLWYLTFGVCYNPCNVKLYKDNTNTNLFGAYNGKIIYAKPALEFRVGVIIGGNL